jgi:type II secretory pathway component GspD/PulD (secretin)
MYLIMRALEASEDARVFSNPKIIVSSGKKAKVDMTEKYPNVTISAKRTSNGGGSDSLDLSMNMAAIPGEDKFMFAKEAFFSWGIELEVTPRINTNGLINVAIVPTISSQTDWVTAGAGDTSEKSNAGTYSSKYPVLNVQRLITEFNMASETTAVIGGLSRTTEKQVDNGIPWLRTWPWIGPKLFGSKVRIKEQKEILVFVTVGLVNPREMKKDAGLPKNAVIGRRYTNGQRLEPGDRAIDSIEGMGGLDLRPLEEQAKDPLPQIKAEDEKFIDFKNIPMPFTKDEKYLKNREKK